MVGLWYHASCGLASACGVVWQSVIVAWSFSHSEFRTGNRGAASDIFARVGSFKYETSFHRPCTDAHMWNWCNLDDVDASPFHFGKSQCRRVFCRAPGSLVHLKTRCRLCTWKVPCFRCVSERLLGAQVTASARVVLRGRRNTLWRFDLGGRNWKCLVFRCASEHGLFCMAFTVRWDFWLAAFSLTRRIVWQAQYFVTVWPGRKEMKGSGF